MSPEDLNEATIPSPRFASRAALLGLSRRRYGYQDLPRSGERVRFQSLSDGEFAAYEDAGFDRDDDTGKITVNQELQRQARARLIVLTAVDDQGKLLFTPDDVHDVAQMDLDDSLALYDAIKDHVGLTSAVKRRKAQEAVVKN